MAVVMPVRTSGQYEGLHPEHSGVRTNSPLEYMWLYLCAPVQATIPIRTHKRGLEVLHDYNSRQHAPSFFTQSRKRAIPAWLCLCRQACMRVAVRA